MKTRFRMRILSMAAAILIAVAGGYLFADWYVGLPIDHPKQFVGRTSCIACHQEQCEKFLGSHHDLAMTAATEETVLGDFDNQTLEHFGVTSQLYRDGKKFMIRTENQNGRMQDFEVKYTFGVAPLQQYMVEIDRPEDADENEIGRLQVLRVSWDAEKKKWFYLPPPDVDEKLDPSDPLHWTGITQNWNTSCAECHSTNLKKNFQLLTGHYRTTFSEIDVSCEACHGPASLHLKLANQFSPFWDRHHGYGLVNLKTPSNQAQVQSCAPCHSRRSLVQEGHQSGCNFDDFYSLQTMTTPIYHADGQIRDEDYVYGSFLQSKMFHGGVRCSDCHDPHSATLIHTGNQVCTSCHQHPAGKYDSPNHHHHASGTAGAACVNCHMPETHYMMIDGRRDHSFRVPRPDLSVSLKSPNACTQCHINLDDSLSQDKKKTFPRYLDLITAAENGDALAAATLHRIDLAMAQAVERWYPPASSPPKTAYYEDLNRAQSVLDKPAADTSISTSPQQTDEAIQLLISLADDKRVPTVIRSTALIKLSAHVNLIKTGALADLRKHLQQGDIKLASAAIQVAENAIGLAQSRIGNRAKLNHATEPWLVALAQLLESDSYRIRTEAARAISVASPQLVDTSLTGTQKQRFSNAIDEFRKTLKANQERAGYHMIAGSLHQRMGEFDQAIIAYRNAISVEPGVVGPRQNLTALLDQRLVRLQTELRNAQLQQQDSKITNSIEHRIDRLQNEIERLRQEEHRNLARDVKLSNNSDQAHWLNYRFGMSSYLQGDYATAADQLELSVQKAPDNETYLLGLATFYIQQQQPEKAKSLVQKLLKQSPDNPSYRSLFERLSQ